MLAGTIDTSKRLFMKQANQIMLGSTLLHHLHGQLIGVAGVVCVGINGRKFVLTRCCFVVLGFGQYT